MIRQPPAQEQHTVTDGPEQRSQPPQPPQQPKGAAPRLKLSAISKSFPGIKANDHIDLSINPGEIHALIGENGAGKSTLVKIVYGVLSADAGVIEWEGKPVTIASPTAARKLGIGMVFQHFSLFEALTVAENIALGLDDSGPIRALNQRITEISARYELPLQPDRHVSGLSVGEKQRIEIVRCLLQSPGLLIMDEPTSVLTPQEAKILFRTLRRLRDEGCAILFISHKLDEVRALCDRASILRHGKLVAACDPREETSGSMAEMMIGSSPVTPRRSSHEAGQKRLEIRDLTVPGQNNFDVSLSHINLELHGGEIVGIAGVAGNGQKELAMALTGEVRAPGREMVVINDEAVGHKGPRRRRRHGMAFVPEERLGQGAVPDMDLAENVLLTGYLRLGLVRYGSLRMQAARDLAADITGQFDVRCRGIQAQAGALSGGNLQKFIIGREIVQSPDVLIAAQPTWGVDSGAAAAIHQALFDLARRGTAILVISQDLDELMLISDRLAVLHEGKLSGAHPTHEFTIEEIGLLMGGADIGKARLAS
ncbi:MAG: ABC transporter [Hyphomicrobiales bacterium]|nr:MAG: ABC transporter [Hyphomicrobiales bacterium]